MKDNVYEGSALKHNMTNSDIIDNYSKYTMTMSIFIPLKTNQTKFASAIETTLSRRIKFCILFSLQIPSILCYLFLLFHLLYKRSMRRSLNNHVFILILFIGLITVLIDLSMILDYLRRRIVIPSSLFFINQF
jgi:hypothetical protein